MKRYILLWLISLTAAVSATAQNRIDRFVDNESTIGRSKFTSVVERDPKTHEVVRVVKVRELTRGIDINACLGIFEEESTTGRFSHNIDAYNQHTLLLAVEGKKQDRIYMLQYTGKQPLHGHDGKVTVVIKMKK
ncbi:MAG: DUF5024 domain-containing protein [Bacteroidaceae bacterium]|nr:DUF5024 domain-containing protein [Bacteroidaceae bacterium]